MSNRKISFNNFKPFGETLQTFSKKSITLVFGPNSVGKSSFIEALLYLKDIQLSNEFELSYSDKFDKKNQLFAGDIVNIDRFDSIIHKKDITKSLNFKVSVIDTELYKKIIDYFDDFFSFKEDGIYEYITIDTDKHIIKNYIDNYDKNKDKNPGVINDFFEYIINDIDWSYKTFKHIMNGNHVHKISFQIIQAYLELLEEILQIQSIEVHYSISKNRKTFLKVDFFINKERLFVKNYQNNEYTVYAHSIIEKLFQIDQIIQRKKQLAIPDKYSFSPMKRIKRIFTLSISNKTSFHPRLVEKSCKDITSNLFSIGHLETLQYIGALRIVPSKDDLFQKTQKKIKVSNLSLKQEYYLRTKKTIKRIEEFLISVKLFLERFQFISIKLNKIELLSRALKIRSKKSDLTFSKKILLKLKILLVDLVLPSFLLLPLVVLLVLLVGIFISVIPIIVFIALAYRLKRRLDFKRYSILGGVTSHQMWLDLIGSEKIQNEINQWLDDSKMKTSYQVNIETVQPSFVQKLLGKKEQYRLGFLDKNTDTIVYPNEIGTGISQVLPVLISSKIRKESTIFIAQPELHLHPALQSEIADEFIKSVNKNKNEFFLETHSEHLLLRIMKRMRQTHEGTLEDEELQLTPDDVCLLYVDNDGKKTFITELELDEDGSLLDPWPGGFFEEGFKERFM